MITGDFRPLALVIWTLGLLAYYGWRDGYGHNQYLTAITHWEFAKRMGIWCFVCWVICNLK